MENKLLKIINYYGLENQQRKLEEEVFELQHAIFEYEYDQVNNKEHIEEELSDVCVLLMQLCNYYKLNIVEIGKIMEQKIDRQLERIQNECNN